MADTIQIQHAASGQTLYALIRNADGQIWNGSSFGAYSTASLGTYDVPMTEQGTASRYYAVAMPAVAAGLYSVTAYVQAGGAPAETDVIVGSNQGEWSGSAWIRLGAPAGASVSADIAAVKAQTAAIEVDTQDLQSRTPAALVGGRMDANVGAISGDATAADNLEAAADGTGYNLGGGAVVAASVTGAVGSVTGNVGGNVTGSVGSVATGGLTAASFAANAITAAKLDPDVTTELQAGLATAAALTSLDGKIGTPSDLGGGASLAANLADIEAQTDDIGTAGAGLTALASAANLATVAGYLDTEIAAIKAKTDNLPAAPAATSDIPTAAVVADAVWDEVLSGHLTSGTTGAGLNAAGSAGDPWSTSLPGAYGAGSAGKIVGDNLNAAVGSLATAANLATVAGYLDTEVAAIKAKTDNLPASPAATSDIPSAAVVADAVWDEVLSGHLTGGTTGAGLNAAGSAGDPWSTALPGAYSAGSAGKILGDNLNATVGSRATQVSVDDVPTNAELATALAGADDAVLAAVAGLNNLSSAQAQSAAAAALTAYDPPTTAEMDARTLVAASYATAAGVSAVETDTQDIQSRLPAALVGGRIDATLDATGMEAGAIDAILDDTIGDGTLTLRQALRVLVAGMAGKLSGAATTTITIRNAADTANVLVATVDADGNRSAVTVTP